MVDRMEHGNSLIPSKAQVVGCLVRSGGAFLIFGKGFASLFKFLLYASEFR